MRIPWWLPFGRVPEIAPEALAARLAASDPPRLLDVRTPGEFEREHLEGAVNVPITTLGAHLGDLALAKAEPIVVICLTAHRSIPAVRLLARAGFRDVRQLGGGMMAYRAWRRRAGLAVADELATVADGAERAQCGGKG